MDDLTIFDYVGLSLAGAAILFVLVHALLINPRQDREREVHEARLKVATILNLKGDSAASREVMNAGSLEEVAEIVRAHEGRSNERRS